MQPLSLAPSVFMGLRDIVVRRREPALNLPLQPAMVNTLKKQDRCESDATKCSQ